MNLLTQLSRIFARLGIGEIEDELLDNLFKSYDENLKGGAHAVKSDDSSRPRARDRFSGREMNMAIGLRARARKVPVMMRQQRSFKESIKKASEPHNRDYEDNPELVEVIEKTAYDLGAGLVGFTEVTPDLIYAGNEVPYRYVVVVAMRMDNEKIATAPSVDCMMDAYNTHGLLGNLVNRLTDKIKEIGYDAVPSPALGGAVDYPSLARMAAMGEYGRHGLLISPFNGSCQRIAAVFTNLKLPVEKSNPHKWISDFCSICGKCIRACPPNAIREESAPTKAGHYSCVEHGECLLYVTTHSLCSICIKECPFTTMSYDRIKEAYERGARSRARASESKKIELAKRASEILSEFGVTDHEVIFSDFTQISRDPLKKAQGYNPEYHARYDPLRKVIEINTALLQKEKLSHWRNWDNIIAHEVGHIILDTPPAITRTSGDDIELALARYQFELYKIAQDLAMPLHILPEKYIDFDLSRIKPWERYSEALGKVRDTESSSWGLEFNIVEKLPFYYGYGHYDSGEEGTRILNEVNRILIQEPFLRSIASDTEYLVKPFAKGKDIREMNLQILVDHGSRYFRYWVALRARGAGSSWAWDWGNKI